MCLSDSDQIACVGGRGARRGVGEVHCVCDQGIQITLGLQGYIEMQVRGYDLN